MIRFAHEIRPYDWIDKPGFFAKPMQVLSVCEAGGDYYATLADPAGGECWCWMSLNRAGSGAMLHEEINKIWRGATIVFERETPKDDAGTRPGASVEGATDEKTEGEA